MVTGTIDLQTKSSSGKRPRALMQVNLHSVDWRTLYSLPIQENPPRPMDRSIATRIQQDRSPAEKEEAVRFSMKLSYVHACYLHEEVAGQQQIFGQHCTVCRAGRIVIQ